MNSPSIILNEVDNAIAFVVFAHGAGADKSSDFMATMTRFLNERQLSVLRFNFNYMDKRLLDGKRYPPERMPKLLGCAEQVLADVDTKLPVYLAGKSMGSRVLTTLCEQPLEGVHGVICLGYPFHPQKKPENLRLEPLQNVSKPVLVIQGERDALGNKSEIAGYTLSEQCQFEFLPDGDHDLKPRVKSGYTHQLHLVQAADKILAFVKAHE